MKIYIAIDSLDKEIFEGKAKELADCLIKRKNTVLYLENAEYFEETATIIAFTNSLEYIKKLAQTRKRNIINITQNLNSEYILDVLEYTKDIYFFRTSTEDLASRIEKIMSFKKDRNKLMKSMGVKNT